MIFRLQILLMNTPTLAFMTEDMAKVIDISHMTAYLLQRPIECAFKTEIVLIV